MAFKMKYGKGGFPYKSAFKQREKRIKTSPVETTQPLPSIDMYKDDPSAKPETKPEKKGDVKMKAEGLYPEGKKGITGGTSSTKKEQGKGMKGFPYKSKTPLKQEEIPIPDATDEEIAAYKQATGSTVKGTGGAAFSDESIFEPGVYEPKEFESHRMDMADWLKKHRAKST
tara:strand:+ start:1411 stop:1923 length:513 start_codon:yes stop_codon:yes gene_type:complete